MPKVILPMPRTVRPKDNPLMPLARPRLVYFAQGLRSSEIDYSRNLLGRVDGDGQGISLSELPDDRAKWC